LNAIVANGFDFLYHRAVMRLLVGRISFVIAHRLSTIREADKVVVMDLGKFVEVDPQPNS
jgi:ABC-type multidrug transport system fused ATPase/permease subunit